MLAYLRIENLALIEHSEVEFASGFNVITGESGAGKSILLEAISLLLGDRADHTVIRTGADRCEVCGVFYLPPETVSAAAPLLATMEIALDPVQPELHLRRVITFSGTRCQVNNVPVTTRILKTIGELLIDVYGADEHQSLTSRTCQLALLDRYAGVEQLQSDCAEICAELAGVRGERAEFAASLPSAAEVSRLEAVVEEIEQVSPKENEDELLGARHRLVVGAKELVEESTRLAMLLRDDENSVTEELSEAYRLLQHMARMDEEKIGEFMKRCAVATEAVRDLAADISEFGSGVEMDAEEFQSLEKRLSALYGIKRRYGPSLGQVLETLSNAKNRLAAYYDGDKRRASLERQEHALEKRLQTSADRLSESRRSRAAAFTEEVCGKLRSIGFPGGTVTAEFSRVEPGANGQDQVELLFSANVGEPMRPLRKIASSGELSRLMLALKTVLCDADRIPVAIFDEIDVNIGGETAAKVGMELRVLGRKRQVLAVSHLPQVAAMGDVHFAVDKAVDHGRTFSRIVRLDGEGRRREIARMLGGGAAALSHAAELLSTS